MLHDEDGLPKLPKLPVGLVGSYAPIFIVGSGSELAGGCGCVFGVGCLAYSFGSAEHGYRTGYGICNR